MISQASLSPVYSLLRSIPGIGELTAVTILAEIGDVNKFPTPKQLVAFSGLDPSVFESGKFKSSNNRISKRGSAYIRKMLYRAVIVGITRHSEKPVKPALYAYYTKKIAEGKPGKVAIVACCNKLLRIIYGVWRCGTPFVNVQ
jgi:transposase